MNPSQPFIMRPVATTLLMIAIMLSGMLAFRFLPVAALPEVDYPTIQVVTFYPGASPDVMGLTVNEAEVGLTYSGRSEQLRDALAQQKLELVDSGGQFTLQLAAVAAAK